MRGVHFNYLRPPHYYSHLFTFILTLAVIMSIGFQVKSFKFNFIDFLLKTIILIFLFLTLASIIELTQRGEYIRPLILYDILGFAENFLEKAQNEKTVDYFFLKYDYKSKKIFKKYFTSKQYYFISTVRKIGDSYRVTIINEKKLFQYFLVKFLIKDAIHTLDVKKIDDKYKIVRFK